MKIRNWLGVVFLMMSVRSAAQVDTLKAAHRVKCLALPVLYYTPETRWAYGAAGLMSFRFKKDSAGTRPSQMSLGITYTQNKQFLAYVPFNIYLRNNRYYLYGEVGYYDYSFDFYGIGEQSEKKELYYVRFPRIKANVLVQWKPHFFTGIRYLYENYDMRQLFDSGLLKTGKIPGGTGSVTGGMGLVQVIDKRDTLYYPTKGYFVEAVLLMHGKALGGNVGFNTYQLDADYYWSPVNHLVWANNAYLKITAGDVPFNMLAMMGGNKKMRGYYEGRYRDKHVNLYQTELRWQFYKRIGATAFGSVGFMGDDKQFLRWQLPKYTGGGGLRYVFDRRDHMNVRLDCAVGKDGLNYYFTFGEAF